MYHRAVRLILASSSPRRIDLLTSAGYEFEVLPAEIDESPLPGETPLTYVRRLAEAKALAVTPTSPDAVVLAADTTVAIDGHLLGKPGGHDDAREMLSRLAGREHAVHTGVAVRQLGRLVSEVATTRVRFLPLSPWEIAWYVASGEPEGKAGAYAIQGRAARFVDWIEGSYSNVVGLPVHVVHRLLGHVGADFCR
jgi:septum formation protein